MISPSDSLTTAQGLLALHIVGDLIILYGTMISSYWLWRVQGGVVRATQSSS